MANMAVERDVEPAAGSTRFRRAVGLGINGSRGGWEETIYGFEEDNGFQVSGGHGGSGRDLTTKNNSGSRRERADWPFKSLAATATRD